MTSQVYVIVSQLNGLALDVREGYTGQGAQVVTWPKHGQANQQWYDDRSTGTIRSNLNNLCMEIEGDRLVLKPFQQGNPNQQWERRGNLIVNRNNPNEVLDVSGSETAQGTSVIKYPLTGKINQAWTYEFVGGVAAAAAQTHRQEFFIVSEMNGKVLDIKDGSRNAGAHIIIWSKAQEAKNQRWYFDQRGYIRSALNDMVFTATNGEILKMTPYSEHPDSQWRFNGNQVVNHSGNVLDVYDGKSHDGAEVCAYMPAGGQNQRWRQEIAY